MFDPTYTKHCKVTLEVTLSDAECKSQGKPLGTKVTVVAVDHENSPTNVEWSTGPHMGWIRWADPGLEFPGIPEGDYKPYSPP